MNAEIFDEALGADALIVNYNKAALAALNSENFKACAASLEKASELLKYSTPSSHLLLRSMTMNNYANLCAQNQDFSSALTSLSSISSCPFPGSKSNLGITYINIGAIESLRNNHESALKHILEGISILKASPNLTMNITTALIIAYHNCSLEYTSLGLNTEAHKYMREAWELALQQLGPDDTLTHTVFQGLSSSGSDITAIQPNKEIKGINKGEKQLQKILGKNVRNLSIGANEAPVRFLTGERLQPMFKTGKYRKVLSRPVSRTANSAIAVRTLNKKYTDPMKKPQHTLSRIGAQIEGLQHKIDTFEERCIPLKVLAEESSERLSSKASEIVKADERMKEKQREKEKAATDIQRMIRGWKERQGVKEKIESQKSAAKVITRVFKGFLGKERLREEAKKIEVITEVEEDKEEDRVKGIDESAVIIQSFLRGMIQRKKYLKLRAGVIKIQATVRMWQVKLIYKSIREAVICIQAYYRGYRVRKQLKNAKP